ncbi:MAG: glycoside hydrolase domain-containing protein [Bacteroidota bacterium]
MLKRLSFLLVLLSIGLTARPQFPVLPYTTGHWNPDTLGNQRVMVEVREPADVVFVMIPWRRKDLNPQDKEILVYPENSGERVTNVIRLEINREYARLIFQPTAGPGIYYFYYLPYKSSGGSYPVVKYLPPEDRCDPAWKKKALIPCEVQSDALALEMQSINRFHSFYPMEVIATGSETSEFLSQYPESDFILFPEYRDLPVRMFSDLPFRWIQRGPVKMIRDTVQQFEYYSFQIAVYALKDDIADLEITFSDLSVPGGISIPAGNLTCFYKGGNNWDQKPLVKTIPVAKGKVQPLWIGVDVPKGLPGGHYRGNVYIKNKGESRKNKEEVLGIDLLVKEVVLEDRGDSKPENHSRLRWLNSDIAVDEGIVAPYAPVKIEGNVLKILGRDIKLNSRGLPEQISSWFAPEMTRIADRAEPLLAEAIGFEVESGGKELKTGKGNFAITRQAEGAAEWTSAWKTGNVKFDLKGRLEFDGFLTYRIAVTTDQSINLSDMEFVIPMQGDKVEYMLGLGRKGGYAPDQFTYTWDPYFNCDGPWLGTVNAGLQATFRAENYERPLNTNFYQQKPLNMPPSWFNDGEGGIKLEREGEEYELTAFTGDRTLNPGDTLHFDINLLITPFRTIDTEKQWHDRYYHKFAPLDTIQRIGANTINVHHATDINPYINYPFMLPDLMKVYIDAAHKIGDKVKIYYTVRELSNICPEIWALKSLGNEILSYGPGGGYSWLQEHLDGNYIPAWFVPELKDAAVINTGTSRWHNYYLEGLDWLVKNVGIDGLYIDDVAFDRSIMKRVRKVLERTNPGALIDLHSANQFNPRDGFTNSANLYLEHFPYLDRLWFGEYFDYNANPDYWLTEVSGIPFGLMGEMLQDGGNQWRGMLYGMTSRAPWSGNPANIWKIEDRFGIQKSEMIGYWVKDCPVQTGRPDVLATVYKKDGEALVAVASWAAGPARISLDVKWKSLGIDPEKAEFYLPAVEKFQDEGHLKVGESFQVPAGKGLLIWIRRSDE